MRGFAAGGPTPRYVAQNIGHHGQGPWIVNDLGAVGRLTGSVVHEIHADAEATAKWLNDRWRGYSSLKRFEGGKLWPNTYRNGQLVYEV